LPTLDYQAYSEHTLGRVALKPLFFLTLLSLFPAVGLQAKEPTYLSCNLGQQHFDITADEQRGTISFFNDGEQIVREEKASFQPDYVLWTMNDEAMVVIRKINRVDLSFTEDMYIGKHEPSRRTGTCTIKPIPTRKF
jgi:hypothetical protein